MWHVDIFQIIEESTENTRARSMFAQQDSNDVQQITVSVATICLTSSFDTRQCMHLGIALLRHISDVGIPKKHEMIFADTWVRAGRRWDEV